MGSPDARAVPPRPWGRGEAAGLAAIAAVALALRGLHWARTPVMFNDGPRFLAQAELFLQGAWAEGVAFVYHPLFALATAGVQAGFGPADPTPSDWENAAAAVSIVSGTLGVVAFYAFLRSAFDRQVAWVGATLLAVHPYSVEFSSDVQSDGLYHALFLASVGLAWSALRRPSAPRALGAGLLAGAAYLTRPEGLGVVAAAGAVGLWLTLRREWRPLPAAAWAAALGVGALLVVAPYLVAQRAEGGDWSLTRKKSVTALAGVREAPREMATDAPPAAAPDAGATATLSPDVQRAVREYEAEKERYFDEKRARKKGQGELEIALRRVGEALHAAESALRPEVLLLVVLGLVSVRGRPGLRGLFLLAVGGVYTAAVLGLSLNYGYVSRRHALPPASLLLGYAALGVPLAGAGIVWLAARVSPTRGGRLRAGGVRTATALGLVAAIAFALGKQLRPVRPDGLAERRAAEWLLARAEADPNMNPAGPIAANRRRVAYYADAPWMPLRKLPVGGPLEELLRSNGVRFVIADEGDLRRFEALADPAGLGGRRVHRAEANGALAWVFDLDAREATPPTDREAN